MKDFLKENNMVPCRKLSASCTKLLMLTVAHFLVTPVTFADGTVLLSRDPVVELQDLSKRPLLSEPVRAVKADLVDVVAPQHVASIPDEHEGPWEVVEDPKVVFARNARQPLVSADGVANPNASVLQGSILDLNDLSYLVAKSQSKKAELAALRNKLKDVKEEIAELEATDDFFGLDEALLDELYSERDDLGVKIQALGKDLQENDKRKDELTEVFVRHGWVLRVFKGKTGYKPQFGDEAVSYVDDDRGIVAYDPSTHSFVICYHGSRNADDWKTNLDGKKIKASEAGLLLGDLEVHRGFAHAAASCTVSICNAVDEILATGISTVGANFWGAGHSQGAGVAALGLADLALRLGVRFYGPGFDNTVSNVFKGLLLSAPRAVAAASLDGYHAIVGSHNVIRQNVDIDPVPVASLRESGPLKTVAHVGGKVVSVVKTVSSPVIAVGEFIDNHTGIFTAAGKTISLADRGIMAASKVGNFAPVRTVFSFIPGAPTAWALYQHGRTAVMTANKVSAVVSTVIDDPRLVGVKDTFATQEAGDAMESLTGYAGVGQLALDPTAEVERRSIWPSLKAWAGRVVTNTIGLFKTRTRFDGQPASVDALIAYSAKDLVKTLFAPVHYGSTVKGASGSFDPKVVGTDLDTMLANGRAHREAAQQEPQGWFAKTKARVKAFFCR